MLIKPITCLITAALCLLAISSFAEEKRPNFVIVLCDDLGYGDLGCFGHPTIKTDRLDQMAGDGIRFTSFYSAAPVCSPSRVGLLTGRSPNRAGVYDWIPDFSQRDPSHRDHRDMVHLRGEESTIASLLQEADYATCMTGKWHCNSRFNQREQPQPDAAGFDHWFATQNNARPSHKNPENFVRNGETVGKVQGTSCQIVVDEAIGWLRDHHRSHPDRPFFLYVPFHEPHEPVASPEELVERYLPMSETREQAEYFANVHNLDLATGRLLDELDDLGVGGNTLVVFSSDNGPETLRRYRGAERSYGTPGPLRGMKLWTTEAGFRVCGIARWPGTISPGTVSDEVVSALDLLPTFCALAGVQPPSDRALDGTNCLAALQGDRLQRDRPLLWCYYNGINERRVAMRHGDWKVLARLVDGEGQTLPTYVNVHPGNADQVQAARLADLQVFKIGEDVAEEHDLAAAKANVTQRLREKLQAAYRELVDDSYVWHRE